MVVVTYNSAKTNWNSNNQVLDLSTDKANQVFDCMVSAGKKFTKTTQKLFSASSSLFMISFNKNNEPIILSEKDWEAEKETRYLLSIPGMLESLIECRNTPTEDFEHEIKW